MNRGRKPIDLEMQGNKGNRQRIWEAIRLTPDAFKIQVIASCTDTEASVVYSYMRALIQGGYVKVISEPNSLEQTLRLIKDTGAEAPAITRTGKPSSSGKGTEAMWRSLRILGEVSANELADHASVATSTALGTARVYLRWLKRAGYVVEVSPGASGRPARYRIAPGKYTGPRPPMIQKIGQVFDPNLGEVVYRQEVAE